MGKDLWKEIVREEQEDELRSIYLWSREDGSLVLEERTDGELTMRTFGTLTCVRRLEVGVANMRQVAAVLGEEGSAEEAVCSFLNGKAFLSELQDVLDRASLPYSYTMTCGNDIALRMSTV